MTKEKKQLSQGSAKKPTQEAITSELTTHRITTKKPTLKKQPFVIHSHTLTADNEQTLENVRQTASDFIGRAISSSAVIRALVRYLAQQKPAWVAKQLHPLIEQEIAEGRLWGTQSTKGPARAHHF